MNALLIIIFFIVLYLVYRFSKPLDTTTTPPPIITPLSVKDGLYKRKRDIILKINQKSDEDLYLLYTKYFPSLSTCSLSKEYTLQELDNLKATQKHLYTVLKECGYVKFLYYLTNFEIWLNNPNTVYTKTSFKHAIDHCIEPYFEENNLTDIKDTLERCLNSTSTEFIDLKLKQFKRSLPIPKDIGGEYSSSDGIFKIPFNNSQILNLKPLNNFNYNFYDILSPYYYITLPSYYYALKWTISFSGTLTTPQDALFYVKDVLNNEDILLGHANFNIPFNFKIDIVVSNIMSESREIGFFATEPQSKIESIYIRELSISITNVLGSLYLFTSSPIKIIENIIEFNSTNCAPTTENYNIKILSYMDTLRESDSGLYYNLLICSYISNLFIIYAVDNWLNKPRTTEFKEYILKINDIKNTITYNTNFKSLEEQIEGV